jgi:hypothetical protein
MKSIKYSPGIPMILLLSVFLIVISCDNANKIDLDKDSIVKMDMIYQSILPINFDLNQDHIKEAIDNLPLLYIDEYVNKEIEYIKPLKSESETILWLVQFAVNSGWMIFSNHVNIPPVIAHNNEGFFSKDGNISYKDLLTQPGPAQIFAGIKRNTENVKNQQISNINLAKNAHIKWSLLVKDVPQFQDKVLESKIIQNSDASARTMCYEHLNMPWVHQYPPFNQNMPMNETAHCFVGPNNLSIGQVFKYYQRPDDQGWDFENMVEKTGSSASYSESETDEWAQMFVDIAKGNQPDQICNQNPDCKEWSGGWITEDYDYIKSFPVYRNADFDSTANTKPGDWNIIDIYHHVQVLKEPVIISARENASGEGYPHTWVIDGCVRTGSEEHITYEVHCLWGWEWDEVSYNGWYNHDCMLSWNLYVSTITDLKPVADDASTSETNTVNSGTNTPTPVTYTIILDEVGFSGNCQSWIKINEEPFILYPNDTTFEVNEGSTLIYRGQSLDVEPYNIRLIIDGPGGRGECLSNSSCTTEELSFVIEQDERILVQALRWAVL